MVTISIEVQITFSFKTSATSVLVKTNLKIFVLLAEASTLTKTAPRVGSQLVVPVLLALRYRIRLSTQVMSLERMPFNSTVAHS